MIHTFRTLTVLLLLGALAHAQTPPPARPTRPVRYLALDVSRPLGGFKRYRFFPGDEIRFRAGGDAPDVPVAGQGVPGRYRETLYDVTDSTFTVLISNDVMNRDEPITFRFRDIRKVYINRRIPFVTAAGTLLPIAGGVYLLAGVVNTRQFDPALLPVTGALVVGGLALNRISNPRYRINKNHRLRALQTF